jgi:hypothetical protein
MTRIFTVLAGRLEAAKRLYRPDQVASQALVAVLIALAGISILGASLSAEAGRSAELGHVLNFF